MSSSTTVGVLNGVTDVLGDMDELLRRVYDSNQYAETDWVPGDPIWMDPREAKCIGGSGWLSWTLACREMDELCPMHDRNVVRPMIDEIDLDDFHYGAVDMETGGYNGWEYVDFSNDEWCEICSVGWDNNPEGPTPCWVCGVEPQPKGAPLEWGNIRELADQVAWNRTYYRPRPVFRGVGFDGGTSAITDRISRNSIISPNQIRELLGFPQAPRGQSVVYRMLQRLEQDDIRDGLTNAMAQVAGATGRVAHQFMEFSRSMDGFHVRYGVADELSDWSWFGEPQTVTCEVDGVFITIPREIPTQNPPVVPVFDIPLPPHAAQTYPTSRQASQQRRPRSI